ncbi:RNA polymerase sigma factor [Sphingobacterium tabacisoli]|uniref:RNA polymerase sigma factor n=1 Tax=Sphingobacterium tabacisoli TaxID=2044855 RepID=A0ABW5L3E2_9SPHI|nr:sigma-70 family RNA polymerase sigma factor [Sphingobacterium tabacisoli]
MRSYFHAVYERYHRRVYVFISKYVDATDDVEDIVQEVFVHLWKHVKALHKHENPESIIFKASRQEVTNYYRRKKIDFTFLEEGYDIEDTAPSQSEQEDKHNRLSGIQSLVDILPERRKTIFLQSVVDELSYSEIALKHKISKSAVAKQITKALDFLKTNSSY